MADPATPLEPSANENSPRLPPSAATRPRSTANTNSPLPGFQPGNSRSSWSTSSPLLCHSILFQQPIKIEISRCSWTTLNSKVYMNRPGLTPDRIRLPTVREITSLVGLSSPALQQPLNKPFSGLPSRHLMIDSIREAREAGRQRPGILYPLLRKTLLSCAAHPDTRLSMDAAPPEAAALRHGERPSMVVDIPEPERIGGTRLPGPSQLSGSRSPRRQSRKQPRNRSSGVYRPKKRSLHQGHWCE